MGIIETIINLLRNTKRDGIENLIDYLKKSGFFESPASTKYHGCYAGGLAKHSYTVYSYVCDCIEKRGLKLDAITSPGQKPLEISQTSIIIACLLHDVCKIGAYIGTEKPYSWNKKQPKGHALLSIKRIKKHIELTDLEELMIKYHMGIYEANEFYGEDDWQTGEYPLRGDHTNDKKMSREESKAARYGKSLANVYFHNPICKIIYVCDEIATLEEKAEESYE